jgi:hypothetical protein
MEATQPNSRRASVRRTEWTSFHPGYYVMVCDSSFARQLRSVFEFCWDFRTRDLTNGLSCHKPFRRFIAILLDGIYGKLPITCSFPGATGADVRLSNFKMSLAVPVALWVSTGLWPAASRRRRNVAILSETSWFRSAHIALDGSREMVMAEVAACCLLALLGEPNDDCRLSFM